MKPPLSLWKRWCAIGSKAGPLSPLPISWTPLPTLTRLPSWRLATWLSTTLPTRYWRRKTRLSGLSTTLSRMPISCVYETNTHITHTSHTLHQTYIPNRKKDINSLKKLRPRIGKGQGEGNSWSVHCILSTGKGRYEVLPWTACLEGEQSQVRAEGENGAFLRWISVFSHLFLTLHFIIPIALDTSMDIDKDFLLHRYELAL